jgi:hypothetical protein
MTMKPAQKELRAKESINTFWSLQTDTLSSRKKDDLRWGPGNDEFINWKIFADGEHISQYPVDAPNSVDYGSATEDNELGDETDLNNLLISTTCSLTNCFHQLLDMQRLLISSMLMIDHPEVADEGVEYDWGCRKGFYHCLPLSAKKTKNKSRE